MCSKLSYIYIKNNSSRSATDKIKPIIELAVRQVNFIALRCAFFSCAAARSDTPINWVRRLGMEKNRASWAAGGR
jgi:hypothetical protein